MFLITASSLLAVIVRRGGGGVSAGHGQWASRTTQLSADLRYDKQSAHLTQDLPTMFERDLVVVIESNKVLY